MAEKISRQQLEKTENRVLGRYLINMCIAIAHGFLRPKNKTVMLLWYAYFGGGGILVCRRRLGVGERKEAVEANTFRELLQSLGKWRIGHQCLGRGGEGISLGLC